MEIKNKLTVTRGERREKESSEGNKGKGCEGTCLKDPGQRQRVGGLNVESGAV